MVNSDHQFVERTMRANICQTKFKYGDHVICDEQVKSSPVRPGENLWRYIKSP